MTLDFSWHRAHGCVTLFPNPEIRLRNIPQGAASLLLTLTQGPRGAGYSDSRQRHFAVCGDPDIWSCNPGAYQWTAQVKSSIGQVLSEAHQARFYPTDELAPEKP